MKLPRSVEAAAVEIGNRELAWLPADVVAAINAIAAENVAILGGEVLGIKGGQVYGLIPGPDGALGVLHWSAESRRRAEPWTEFVRRSAAAALDCSSSIIADLNKVETSNVGDLHFCLTWADEREYEQLVASTAG